MTPLQNNPTIKAQEKRRKDSKRLKIRASAATQDLPLKTRKLSL